MWWAFGAGVAVGLILGIASAALLIPRLMELVNQVINKTSLSVKYPSIGEILEPFQPGKALDPYADLGNDTERVPSWMGDEDV